MPMFRMKPDKIEQQLGWQHKVVEATQCFRIDDFPIKFEGSIFSGDWLVTCVHGNQWVVKQDVFEAEYDKED